MVITPNSKIILIKNPLKLDSNNEIMFASKNAQETYFQSLPKLEFNDLTYVRKEGVLRVPTDETGVGLTYEDLLGYNFCMYQNTHFSDKWFYAFITEVTWVNPSLTEMKLETAYYQTWQFDLIYKDSYIEREHVSDDTIGVNLVDEGISPQEHIVDNSFDLNVFNKDNFKVLIAVSELVAGGQSFNIPFVSTQGNVFSGMCFICSSNGYTTDAIIRGYDEAGRSEAIKYMFMVPNEMITLSDYEYAGQLDDGTTWYKYRIVENNSGYNVSLGTYDKPTTLDTYNPKNKKLLQYPYCYLSIDPHSGNSYDINYEDIFMANNKYGFAIDGILSVGCSVKITPINYKMRSGTNYTYGFTGIKYPTCGWISDTYTNWITQNSVNLGFGKPMSAKEFGLLSGITSLVAGGVLAGTGSATTGTSLLTRGIGGIFNTLQSDYKGSMQVDQVRGNENAGDINFALGLVNPTINQMSIKRGQAQIIDNYFSMFGYKVNRLGIPHLHVRSNYDYIKTIDVNIEGDIPEQDLNKIREMFNNGIRFWHTTTNYLDFSVNNSIIT